jgi:hypothetical protein
MNAIVGHRIAKVSVHRFISDVAGYLRQALAYLNVLCSVLFRLPGSARQKFLRILLMPEQRGGFLFT